METPKKASIRGVADIVFLIDATGSMMPCIRAVRECVLGFVEGLEPGSGSDPLVRDWRVRVVGYRDRPDSEDDWIEEGPFVRSAELLREQLARLEAKGGGGEPESLLDALYYLARLPPEDPLSPRGHTAWRPRREAHRFIVVFTDATFHPTFRNPAAVGPSSLMQFEDVADSVEEAGIWLHIFAPDFDCFQPMSEIDRCKWHSIPLLVEASTDSFESAAFDFSNLGAHALRRLVQDRTKFSDIMRALGKSISQSSNACDPS
jgi:hypothetical protein